MPTGRLTNEANAEIYSRSEIKKIPKLIQSPTCLFMLFTHYIIMFHFLQKIFVSSILFSLMFSVTLSFQLFLFNLPFIYYYEKIN